MSEKNVIIKIDSVMFVIGECVSGKRVRGGECVD